MSDEEIISNIAMVTDMPVEEVKSIPELEYYISGFKMCLDWNERLEKIKKIMK